MTRKDYKIIADCLRINFNLLYLNYPSINNMIKDKIKENLIDDFCTELKRDNYNFNSDKFRNFIEKGK